MAYCSYALVSWELWELDVTITIGHPWLIHFYLDKTIFPEFV